MTFRTPYENLFTPSYRWSYAPEGWQKTSSVTVSPFRRYMLTLQAEAIVRDVPLVVEYHGQVRGDAAPDKEETSERRVIEEGRQMSRWMDNTGRYQRGGKANRGTSFAANKVKL